jgi:hypothetical protein
MRRRVSVSRALGVGMIGGGPSPSPGRRVAASTGRGVVGNGVGCTAVTGGLDVVVGGLGAAANVPGGRDGCDFCESSASDGSGMAGPLSSSLFLRLNIGSAPEDSVATGRRIGPSS